MPWSATSTMPRVERRSSPTVPLSTTLCAAQPELPLVLKVLEVLTEANAAEHLLKLTTWIMNLQGTVDQGTCQALLNVASLRRNMQLATRVWNMMEV